MTLTPNDGQPATAHPGHGESISQENISHMEPDNIGVPAMTILFALVAVVILLIVVLLQAWFYNWKVDLQSELQRNPQDEQQTAAAIAKIQLERIETFGWADPKTKKDRTIPIGLAMELVAKEFATPAPSGSPSSASPSTDSAPSDKDKGDK